MTESLYQYVMAQLEASRGEWPAVAAGAGVSIRSLEKIARGTWKNPGIITIDKLASYFRRRESRSKTHSELRAPQ